MCTYLRRRRKRENFESLRSLSYSMQDISLQPLVASSHLSLDTLPTGQDDRTGTPVAGCRTGRTGAFGGTGTPVANTRTFADFPVRPNVWSTSEPPIRGDTVDNPYVSRLFVPGANESADRMSHQPGLMGEAACSEADPMPGDSGVGDDAPLDDDDNDEDGDDASSSRGPVVVHTDSFFGRDLSRIKIALSNHRDVIRPRNVKKKSRKL